MTKVNIPHDPQDDTEGIMYDGSRAYEEGLHEEYKLYTVTGVYGDAMGKQLFEVQLDPSGVEALRELLPDISANVAPGEIVELDLVLKYRYDYGRAS